MKSLGAALIVATLLLLAALGMLGFDLRNREAGQTGTVRLENIAGTAERLLISLVDAETGHRGFLLTGQEPYPQPYLAALGALPQHAARLRRLAVDVERRVMDDHASSTPSPGLAPGES